MESLVVGLAQYEQIHRTEDSLGTGGCEAVGALAQGPMNLDGSARRQTRRLEHGEHDVRRPASDWSHFDVRQRPTRLQGRVPWHAAGLERAVTALENFEAGLARCSQDLGRCRKISKTVSFLYSHSTFIHDIRYDASAAWLFCIL